MSILTPCQNESKCETIHMICTSLQIHFMIIKLIFIWNVSHKDSFWNRGTRIHSSMSCAQEPLISICFKTDGPNHEKKTAELRPSISPASQTSLGALSGELCLPIDHSVCSSPLQTTGSILIVCPIQHWKTTWKFERAVKQSKETTIHRMQIWRTTRSAPGTSMKVRLVRPGCSVLTMLPLKSLASWMV